ncbi:MAG: hypothetical protein ACLGSA_02225 [Acidobacteriota bacterium]
MSSASRPNTRSGSRLGKDPLSQPASSGSSQSGSGGQALRHILDLGPVPTGSQSAVPPDPRLTECPALHPGVPRPETDASEIYREVAGKFTEAMESLSRMAAAAGAWAWSGQTGEGDSFLFMRLMAAYSVAQKGEGVDFGGFLRDVSDHWERFDLGVVSDGSAGMIPLNKAFTLSRVLQCCLEGFCWPGRRGRAAMTLYTGLDARGRPFLRLVGSRRFFPLDGSLSEARGAAPLLELAKCKTAALRYMSSELYAELAVTALG